MLNYLKPIAWLSLILLPLFMTGCKNIETYYQGYNAESESTTPLTRGKNQQGRWKTFDIDLNYRYDHAENLLKISGTIDLGFYYEVNAVMINRLDVYLFFLDDSGKVIKTAALLRALPFEVEESLTFSKDLHVPPGIEAISFGYNGEARRSGDRGGDGVETFYDLPKRVKP